MADPIGQWFAQVDTDRSGRIDAKELQRALSLGNLNFSLATVAHMIRVHDTDNTGSITLNEFYTLHQFLVNMQNSFNYFDTDRSQSLTLNEIHQALQHAGFRLDQAAFMAMVKAFDPDTSGSLGLPEFIAMTLFLKSASAVFTAFDATRQGRITLDFNQFVYATSNCR